MSQYFDTYTTDGLPATDNGFIGQAPDLTAIPAFTDAHARLPSPYWNGHDDAIACYWDAWRIGWSNLRAPLAGSGFVAPFVDTAFNGCLFLWDSVFILEFGRYARQVFDTQRTLDNFYAKQHEDGFICREIDWKNGKDRFHRHDPVSTGPNLLAWSEWQHWQHSGDLARLRQVFSPILGYHRWMRQYRTWPDGSYWSSGWGCGMDNQPRPPVGTHPAFHHGWMSWIDANSQALLSARLLLRIASVLGRSEQTQDLRDEITVLETLLSRQWNPTTGCHVDRHRDGSLGQVIGAASFWPLLAGATTPEQTQRLVELLEDPRHFNRPHRVPSLGASHPAYNPDGDYWCGSVWPPVVLCVVRALSDHGRHDLAYAIGRNHLDNVVAVHRDTGTLWENYSPEAALPGKPAKPDFVGWSGIGPITILLEQIFGLRPEADHNLLVWDVRLCDGHGVERYPFGRQAVVDLAVDSRASPTDRPQVRIRSTRPLTVDLRWAGGSELLEITATPDSG